MFGRVLGWALAAVLVLGAYNVFKDPAKAAHVGRTTGVVLHNGGNAVGNAADAGATAVDAAVNGK